MPTIERVSDAPYQWRIGTAPLEEVANQEKMMPKSFFSDDGFGITAEARRYFAPLIVEKPTRSTPRSPVYIKLEKHLVDKKLPSDERW